MSDLSWCKNLAQFEPSSGDWKLKNDLSSDPIPVSKINAIVCEMHEEAKKNAYAFTAYSLNRIDLKVLPIQAVDSRILNGFIILHGKNQIRIERNKKLLMIHFTEIIGFDIKERLSYTLTPRKDFLGEILWDVNGNRLVNSDLIVKIMLETLVKESLKST